MKIKHSILGATLILLISVLIFTGCPNDVGNINDVVEIDSMDDISADRTFEYTTTQMVSIDISYEGYDHMAFDLYAGEEVTEESLESEEPFSDFQYIGRFFLNDDGDFTTEVSLATRYDSLVLSVLQLGLPSVQIIEISDGEASYTYSKETRASSSSSVTSRSVISRAVSGFSYFEDSGYYYLSEYNSSGKPSNIYNPYYEYGDGWDDTVVEVTSDLFDTVNATLPEYSKVWADDERKDFLIDSNITIKDLVDSDEDVKVEITFLHEGAGYLNALGYQLIDSDELGTLESPPVDDESTDEYEGMVIAFPNASYAGGGGRLYTGDTVTLEDIDPGKTIIWTLLPNGWSRSGRNRDYSDRFYSYSAWNPEEIDETDSYDRKENIHTVVLLDHKPDEGASADDPAVFIIGFEDLNRQPDSTDDDFNDLVFMVTVSPAEAVDGLYEPDSGFEETIKEGTDTDNDGAPDAYDEFPDNDELASTSSYSGYIAFEDQWPAVGDYDFNDLVAEYTYDFALNADNEVRALTYSYNFIALGAGWQNGMGVKLPIDRSKLTGEDSDISDDLDEIDAEDFTISTDVDEIVITISENINRDLFTLAGYEPPTIINTVYPEGDDDSQLKAPVTVTDRLYFSDSDPVELSEFGNLPFDIFLIQGGDPSTGYEIHLPDTPLTGSRTSYDDQLELFGTADDASSVAAGIYFKTENNLPWALHMPDEWTHPLEGHTILQAYPRFGYWASSNGTDDLDWYTEDNRDADHLFPVDRL